MVTPARFDLSRLSRALYEQFLQNATARQFEFVQFRDFLRPPLPARVRWHQQSPAWIRSAIANGRVVRCAGPWRTTGGWWSSEERFAFDQFDVQSEDGVVVRLRFDHVRREWQIDAVYD